MSLLQRKSPRPPPSQDVRFLGSARTYLLSVLLAPLARVRLRQFRLYIEHLSYIFWVNFTFPESRYHYSRERLWQSVIKVLQSSSKGEKWSVYELGVAHGYTTYWFLNRDIPQIIKWRGFDLFTGLPSKWRSLDQGSFSNNGQIPTISDNRVIFVKGDVKVSLPKETVDDCRKLIIFDLDLYEPTLSSWAFFEPHLMPGDILIFDEAFDSGERAVIEHHVMRKFVVEAIAHTHTQLALQIGHELAS